MALEDARGPGIEVPTPARFCRPSRRRPGHCPTPPPPSRSSWWPWRTREVPASRSHTRTVLSSEPETMRPSPNTATALTLFWWPWIDARGPGIEVPHPHGFVVRAGDDLAIAQHRPHVALVALEDARGPGVEVPHPHGFVGRAGDDAAIAQRRHRGHIALVSLGGRERSRRRGPTPARFRRPSWRRPGRPTPPPRSQSLGGLRGRERSRRRGPTPAR